MTDNRTTELLPCPLCGKKVYIGLYDDGRGYWWMVHGGMHHDECHCRLFVESCKFELEDDMKVDYDEHAMGVRGWLAKRWNTRAERTCECGWRGFVDGWGHEPPNYCPRCGGKVVGE